MNDIASPQTFDVAIPIDQGNLPGFLDRPVDATGLVLFAHGSGSSRFSSRNRAVAEVLNRSRLATLLFDLLTPDEHERDMHSRALRFDIPLLTERLVRAVDWAHSDPRVSDLPLGLFGASTGAAAALRAAVERPDLVRAVVSRGGRPDLADEALPKVRAPTLLIVGGLDVQVLELNRDAAARMTMAPELQMVPGATHLFEEPGTLGAAASLATDWLRQHLA
jgi:dienelactone hydrolase